MPRMETKEARTGVGCITSPDGGVTWTRIDGTPLELPATLDTVGPIVTCDSREGRIADSGSMAVSPGGVPHVVYSVRVQESAQAYLATPLEGGGWRHLRLNTFLPEDLRHHAMILQGGVVFAADGAPWVVSTVQKPGYGEETWGHPSTGLVVLRSGDGGRTFVGRRLTVPGGRAPAWLPSLEKPGGSG
jgi:hypothetical protein